MSDVALKLLDNKCLQHHKDRNGYTTALKYACENGMKEVEEKILEHKYEQIN